LRPWSIALSLVAVASTARADQPVARPIVGFRVAGHSKVRDHILGYLAHVHLGDPVSIADIPRLETALISSELFESAKVTLEDAPGGVIVVATVEDKLSWIVGPTLYVLPTNRAFGVGYAENDFRGDDQKFLLYAQIGTQTSILFGTFLDPSVRGTPLTWRADLYLERRQIDEYANPPADPTDLSTARTTEETFLDAGALIGWNFAWWLVGDLRLRGAYVYFRDPLDPRTGLAAPRPEKDGWDFTVQARLTLDHRIHRFGVTTGGYAQLQLEPSLPGLDSYGYFNSLARAYYSWELFREHELEVRVLGYAGYHLPIHEDNALGGVGDLRGYPTDQFRGDLNLIARAEYSVPLFKWWIFAFRGLAFYDTGFSEFAFPRADVAAGGDRAYLPDQLGHSVLRNDVGAGLRVYVKAVVLPLLGLDLGYGIEGHSPEVYFEAGLTDF